MERSGLARPHFHLVWERRRGAARLRGVAKLHGAAMARKRPDAGPSCVQSVKRPWGDYRHREEAGQRQIDACFILFFFPPSAKGSTVQTKGYQRCCNQAELGRPQLRRMVACVSTA